MADRFRKICYDCLCPILTLPDVAKVHMESCLESAASCKKDTGESLGSKPIVIACCANEKYAMPMAVTIYSSLHNLGKGRDVALYVIGADVTQSTKDRIARIVNTVDVRIRLEFVMPDMSRLMDFPLAGHLEAETYVRLLLSTVIPQEFDKVLYLDCDVLVVGDLSGLWDLPLEDRYILAARQMELPTASDAFGYQACIDLGIDPDAPNYNAGVVLINLKAWRQNHIEQQMLDWASRNEKYIRCADQDVLNVVLAGKFGLIDSCWNYNPKLKLTSAACVGSNQIDTFVEGISSVHTKQVVYHFAGPLKAWTCGVNVPERWTWMRYLCSSRWFSRSRMVTWFVLWLLEHAGIYVSRFLSRMRDASRDKSVRWLRP